MCLWGGKGTPIQQHVQHDMLHKQQVWVLLPQNPTPAAYTACHAGKVAVIGFPPHNFMLYLRAALIGNINTKVSIGQTSIVI